VNLHTLVDLAQLAGTVVLVAGALFGLVQFFEYKKQRAEAVAGEVMHTFLSAELARALTILRSLPDAVSAERLREEGFEAEYAAVLVSTTFETLGVLVYRRIAPFPLVVELAGGIIVVMWRKLGPWMQQIRIEQSQPSWAEWFEWLAHQCERHKDEVTPAYIKHAGWSPWKR
jgi:hypothetical protein